MQFEINNENFLIPIEGGNKVILLGKNLKSLYSNLMMEFLILLIN